MDWDSRQGTRNRKLGESGNGTQGKKREKVEKLLMLFIKGMYRGYIVEFFLQKTHRKGVLAFKMKK